MGIRQSEQLVFSEFKTDQKGNPSGGTTTMTLTTDDGVTYEAMQLHYQDGIITEGQSGVFVEDVLEAARQRLQFFQASKFRCRENAIALTHIETALAWLDFRTRSRLVQGVENTYEQHESID